MSKEFPQNLSPKVFQPVKGDRTIASPTLSGGFIDGFALNSIKKGFKQAVLRQDDAAATYFQIETAKPNVNLWLIGIIHEQHDAVATGDVTIFDAASGAPDTPGVGTHNYGNIRIKNGAFSRNSSPAVIFLPYPILMREGIRAYASGVVGNLQFVTIFYMIEDQ